MRRLLLVVIAFIVYGSLYPFDFHFDRTAASPLLILLHAWPAQIDRFAWRDAAVNVLLYFPLGLTAVLVLSHRLPRAIAALAAIIFGVALSASIEMLQIFDSTRTCSLLDVACNFVGTVGGIAVALIFEREIFAITRRRTGDRGAAGALLLASCWLGYQLYPFVPRFSRGYLRANIARFLATPISPVEVCASAAEWFAFALLMRALDGRPKTPWLLPVMLCLPLRLLIMERSLSPSELLGAALALLGVDLPRQNLASPRRRRHPGRGHRTSRTRALHLHFAGALHVVDSLRRHPQQRASQRNPRPAPQGLRIRNAGLAAPRLGPPLLDRGRRGRSRPYAPGNRPTLPPQPSGRSHRRRHRHNPGLHPVGQRTQSHTNK